MYQLIQFIIVVGIKIRYLIVTIVLISTYLECMINTETVDIMLMALMSTVSLSIFFMLVLAAVLSINVRTI